jgi:DoxX
MLQRCSALAYSLMRIVAGALFACHGAQKLFGVLGGTIEVHDSEGLTAGLIELFGGSLISLGILTPLAAFVACATRILAYSEPGRTGSALLFCFSVHCLSGKWTVECSCALDALLEA